MRVAKCACVYMTNITRGLSADRPEISTGLELPLPFAVLLTDRHATDTDR